MLLNLKKSIALSILLLTTSAFTTKIFAQDIPKPSVTINESQNLCHADLGKEIDAIINRPQWKRSRWGILIQPLDSDTPIYSHDSDRYFTPASNVKLLTTAAALLKLGSQFRIRTSAYATGVAPNLTSLRIVGRGDPSFTTIQLKELVKQIKNKGIRHIEKLIVDDSYFPKPNLNSSWEWSDLSTYYAPSINSLILNENAVTLTLLPQQIGQSLQLKWSDSIASRQWRIENETITAPAKTESGIEIDTIYGEPTLQIKGKRAIDSEPDKWNLSVVDPANYFLESLRVLLMNERIIVRQGLIIDRDPPAYGTPRISGGWGGSQEIAAIESPTLAKLIQTTNQDSNNLYAESLLKIIGVTANNSNNLEVLKQKLTELGVDSENYNLVDGSGLSRQNLVSPSAIAQTLRQIANTPEAEIYKQSLPVAGVSGTLKNRLKNTLLETNLQAKTGTITGTSALSGYLQLANNETLVFSIMVERANRDGVSLRRAIDEIVLLVSRRGAETQRGNREVNGC
ncbi:MAG: D-alanyl-D-alanine carboxypeptidase/D-alanyl-D-alanine endopeptidase [Xenococcaceae cyanobacterium]